MKHILGMLAAIGFGAVAFSSLGVTRYVRVNNPTPSAPYASWATAATTIQQAIDVATTGDLILVTNGIYQTGGRLISGMSNRVAVTKVVTVQSVNGPAVTTIMGNWTAGMPSGLGTNSMRAVYLTNQARLHGFTVTGGATRATGDVESERSGGGIWSLKTGATEVRGVVSNCIVVGNSASFEGGGIYGANCHNSIIFTNVANIGGGIYWSEAHNSLIISNYANEWGGGISDSSLFNCTVVGNHCQFRRGGGFGAFVANAYSAVNSVIYYNTVTNPARADLPESNYYPATAGLFTCCTLPSGSGFIYSFTNAPRFVGPADFRLQATSPCINAGINYLFPIDLARNPRIVGGMSDIGCYEYQAPTSVISYEWLQRFGFPLNGSVDFLDADNDGMNTYQEWRADTNPTNAASVFRLSSWAKSGTNIHLTWQGGRTSVVLERATNATGPLVFIPVATNYSPNRHFLDRATNARVYYRLRVP